MGRSATAAKLRLYAALSGTGSVTNSVYGVSNTTWSETTTNWNNKPALGAVQNNVAVTSTTYGWKEVDVTSYVAAEKAAGRNVVSLGLELKGARFELIYVRALQCNLEQRRRRQLQLHRQSVRQQQRQHHLRRRVGHGE